MKQVKLTISTGPFPGASYRGYNDWTFYTEDLDNWMTLKWPWSSTLHALDTDLQEMLEDADHAENDGCGPWVAQVSSTIRELIKDWHLGDVTRKSKSLVLAGIDSEGGDFDLTIHFRLEVYEEDDDDQG